MRNILIIKHGALGDIILASNAFAAIRVKYPHAHIAVLTSKAYADLLSACPDIDAVLIDTKPKPWQFAGIKALKALLHSQPWELVIDLQCSTRSSNYLKLMNDPKWCGAARGASHRTHYDTSLHAYDNLKAQLALLDIPLEGMPATPWLNANIKRYDLPETFGVLVPGAAPHRPQKRWPHYRTLAQLMLRNNITPVLIGGPAEMALCKEIAHGSREVINLCGNTTIAQIAGLGRGATLAVGNDTGPMHVLAGEGCPSLVLFSADSTPERSAPPAAKTLQSDDLADLSPETVWEAASALDTQQS